MSDEVVKAEHEAFKKKLPGIIEASKKFMEELKKEEAEDEDMDEAEDEWEEEGGEESGG
jgi:Sec-independent protein translocase protein TatA